MHLEGNCDGVSARQLKKHLWRETCCAGHMWGTRGIFLALSAPQGMLLCCCVAVLTEGTDNLLPFVAQLVYFVLQTTHIFSKHTCVALENFSLELLPLGLLGRVVELKCVVDGGVVCAYACIPVVSHWGASCEGRLQGQKHACRAGQGVQGTCGAINASR